VRIIDPDCYQIDFIFRPCRIQVPDSIVEHCSDTLDVLSELDLDYASQICFSEMASTISTTVFCLNH